MKKKKQTNKQTKNTESKTEKKHSFAISRDRDLFQIKKRSF